MKTAYVLALTVLLAWVVPARCAAARIALKIEPSSSFRPGAATVTAKLTNLGDEPAHQVWVEARLGERGERSPAVESLGVGETTLARISLGQIPPNPGIPQRRH